MKVTQIAVLLGAILIAMAAGVAAAERGSVVTIGAEMPDFTLTDYTGAEHTLSDYRGQVVVLEFLSKDCPYSAGVAPSIANLARSYEDRDVVFIGIDATRGVTQEQNAAHAKSAGIPYPIVRDEQNVYADRVGATRTPELYIVNREGALVYHGAFDDRVVPTEPGKTKYAQQAIEAALAGNRADPAEVSAWGCAILRVAKRPGNTD